jgi:ElaB/YqjD/DUF883 family membrane-anchored ribosome-binding protein
MHTSTHVEKHAPDRALRAKNRMASDFNALVSDAEELLRSTATYSGESVNAARTRFQDSLDHFKSRVSDAQATAVGKFNHAAKATDTYVHENPWKVLGLAAAIGVIFGLLVHRK